MKKTIKLFDLHSVIENKWMVATAAVLGLVIGMLLAGGGGAGDTGREKPAVSDVHEHSGERIWTCSMHPQIRQSKAGKCPLCGMDLIPVDSGEEKTGARELKLSPNAVKLAEIETTAVSKSHANALIPMAGRIEYDESRIKTIAARIPGRIDKLFVDFTGTSVRKGDPLVMLYSPELITAQEELIQALRFSKVNRDEELLDITKQKLRLWGLTRSQISDIASSGETEEHLTIFSPLSGTVIHKNAVEGSYVQTGSRIYTVADLSKLWIILDVYESELPWVRLGQTVKFEAEAYPGTVFESRISFIDPVINPKTRTVRVRSDVDNSGGRLKPDMFVRAIITAAHEDSPKPDENLLIPVTAPLITGKRAVVYVKEPERDGVFSGREIVLGPRAGDFYIVKDGLKEGEEVVIKGAFKIDSDLQIQAKPSMMNPEPAGLPPTVQVPEKFSAYAQGILDRYFKIGDALSRDSLVLSRAAASDMLQYLKKADMSLLSGDPHMRWKKLAEVIRKGSAAVTGAEEIEKARTGLEEMTDPVQEALLMFGPSRVSFFRIHCPMAFDNRGAYWLQKEKQVRNPYFGESMLICNDGIEEITKDGK